MYWRVGPFTGLSREWRNEPAETSWSSAEASAKSGGGRGGGVGGENKPMQQGRLKPDQLVRSFAEKSLEVLRDDKMNTSQWCTNVAKNPCLSGMSIASRSGEMFLCFCFTLRRLHQKCRVQFGAPQDKYWYWYAGASAADGTKVVGAGVRHGDVMGTGLVQPGEVKAKRRSYCYWEEQGEDWAELREEKLPPRPARTVQSLLQPGKPVSEFSGIKPRSSFNCFPFWPSHVALFSV